MRENDRQGAPKTFGVTFKFWPNFEGLFWADRAYTQHLIADHHFDGFRVLLGCVRPSACAFLLQGLVPQSSTTTRAGNCA